MPARCCGLFLSATRNPESHRTTDGKGDSRCNKPLASTPDAWPHHRQPAARGALHEAVHHPQCGHPGNVLADFQQRQLLPLPRRHPLLLQPFFQLTGMTAAGQFDPLTALPPNQPGLPGRQRARLQTVLLDGHPAELPSVGQANRPLQRIRD